MWISLQHGTVHEGPGITFVGVADEVLPVAGGFPTELPFQPGGKAAASPAAQAGGKHFVDYLVGCHAERALQPLVAAAGEVVVQVLRVDDAAVAGGDADLGCEQWEIEEAADAFDRDFADIPHGILGEGAALLQFRFQDGREFCRGNPVVGDAAPAGNLDIHERFGEAHADAADRHDVSLGAEAGEFFRESGQKISGTGGQPAGGGADIDDGTVSVLEARPGFFCFSDCLV